MRKFGIAIAIGAVAVVGFTPKAFASGHEGTLCPIPQMIADGAEGDPTPNPFPGGPGTPVKQIAQGAADACTQSDPTQLVCGVANGIEGMSGGDPLSAGIKDGVGCGSSTPPPAPPGDDDDDDRKRDNKKEVVKGDVVENNAAPGGTLPRTGGELQLLGGLSMGLTGLGVFARRFLS